MGNRTRAALPAKARALVSMLAFAAALALTAASPAWAGPFPIEETFTHAAAGPHWVLGGSSALTASTEAEGWLRLTSAENSQFGFAYDNEAFPSSAGALVEFEYADWGGSGADGLTFFLFNGDTTETEFHPGQPGGSLGYAPCNSASNGLTNAYIGVGFDEYGNFTNLKLQCGLDGEAFQPDHVSVRGSEGEAYKLLSTAETAESLRAERSQARRVTIAITPAGKLSVYIRFPDGTYQHVTQGFQLPAAPATLKFGYVASTGSLNDNHEIRQARVLEPTQLTPTISKTGGGGKRGEALTWTAVVRNEGPNAAQKAGIRASSGEQPIANVAWTCESAGGAACAASSGSGLPDLDAGAMPEGSSLTYKITGTPTAAANYAQMTVEAEPLGEAGELDPEKDKATSTSELTPLFDKAPVFTLAASGLASATPGSALGGGVAYGYQWQRCEASGSACVNIAGAQALAFQTTSADREHTIRFTQTATNTAGSAVADSAVYEPLPTATITSAPASYVASADATLTFTSATGEASFECSLDGGAWSACTSSKSYTGLAAGSHTFSVRASYGGLGAPTHPSASWTVELTRPHAPTIVSAPASHSAVSTSTFKFGDLEKNDALECSLDQGAWAPCSATTELAALADGVHHIEARQVDRAGLTSTASGYTWTIQTGAPPAPLITSAPEEETTQASAQFSFSHEAEATIECSVDGKAYVKCTSGMSLTGLGEGWHTLTARQVSAAGVDSELTTYRWHVASKAKAGAAAGAKTPTAAKTAAGAKGGAGAKAGAGANGGAAANAEPPASSKSKAKRKRKAKRRRKPKRRHKARPRRSKTKAKAKARPKADARPEAVAKAKAKTKVKPDAGSKPQAPAKPKLDTKARPQASTQPPALAKAKVKADAKPKAATEPKPKVATEPKPKVATEPKPKVATEPKPKAATEPKPKATPEAKTEAKPGRQPKTPREPRAKTAPAISKEAKPETRPDAKTQPAAKTVPAAPPAAEPETQTEAKTQPRAKSAPEAKTQAEAKTRRPNAKTRPKAKTTPETGTKPKPQTQPKPKTQPQAKPRPRRQPKAEAAPQPTPPAQPKGTPQTKLLVEPFATGSWTLVAAARKRVEQAAAEIAGARLVTCVGYTDDSGDSRGNLEIGLRRARTVCAALRALGVHASFRARSGGDAAPLASNQTAAGRRLNRRVEVRVVY